MALLYPYSAMDGELKYIHVVWIPAIHAGMTGFNKLVYNEDGRSLRTSLNLSLRQAPRQVFIQNMRHD